MRSSLSLLAISLLFYCQYVGSYQFISSKLRHSSIRSPIHFHYSSFTTRKYLANELSTFSTAISSFIENPSNGLIIDMITAAFLGVSSDCIAQITSQEFEDSKPSTFITTILVKKWNYDWDRSGRFAIFGFFDGAVGHTWFYTLEHFIKDSRAVDIITKIVADTTLYTPLWCVWFLVAMTFLEKGSLKGIFKIVTREWASLLKLSTSFYLPIACFLYSVVPVQKRVLASALGTMVCTIALSLWNATRNKNDKSRAALKKSNAEAAAVNKSDSSSHNKSEESLTTAQDTLS